MLKQLKVYLFLYLAFCLVGAGLEWGYGTFWSKVGVAPWVYPNSPLHYTSLEGLPLWGLGGLVSVSIYRAIVDRKAKRLLWAVIPLLLAALWIFFYSRVLYPS